MSSGLNASAGAAAAAAIAGSAGVAGAQPYYGYGQLPPAPYEVYGGGGAGGGCGGDRFTLLGAHAGVTVLGVDLGAGVGLSVPTGYCGEAQPESFQLRPYAMEEPAPAAYGPPPPPSNCTSCEESEVVACSRPETVPELTVASAPP